jgi:ubiquinone/menaquinone biosynthesis C-methylase UbiE
MELGAESIISIDISKNFIEIAKSRSISGCDFIVADGKEIPVPDNSVDIVFSNYVIHYFPDTSIVFSEVARVLKPGGYFMATFNITDVEEGFEHLYNQQMTIRLGNAENSLIIHNLIKSREEIEYATKTSGLTLVKEMGIDNPASVVDETDENKSHITKHPTLMLLRKS